MSIKFKDNSTRPDGLKSFFGDANDLAIYHDGSNSYIDNSTGNLTIDSGVHLLARTATGESLANFYANGANEFFYDNSKKFETTSTGVTVTGNARVTGAYYDSANSPGAGGQVLTSTATGTDWIDATSLPSESAEKVIQSVRMGEAVSKGDPLVITGYHGSTGPSIVERADATNSTYMPAYGVALEDYAINATGLMIAVGDFDDFDTSSYSVGDTLYVAVGGGMTNVKPTGTALIQNIGIVSRSNANNGQLEVVAIGRTNDVPNLPTGRLFVGTSGNTSLTSDVVYIDDANDRVGIGTTSPTHLLTLETASSPGLKIKDTTQGATLLAFSQDSNSHIGTYSSHPLVLDTNSSERMRITSAGNVGIGTTGPAYKLDVAGDAQIQSSYFLRFANEWGIQQTGTDLNFAEIGSADGRLYLKAGGNVGIGTTAPGTKFHVYNGEATIASSTDGVKLSYSNGNSSGIIDTAFSDNNLEFRTNGTTKMWIANAGNVGIGTTSPDAKLSVTSTTINSEDILYLKSGADNVNDYLGIAWELGVGGNGPHSAIRSFAGPSGSDARLGFLTTSNGGTTLTEGLSIAHNGNVGIGNTAPNYKLTVTGDAGFSDWIYASKYYPTSSTTDILMQTGAGRTITLDPTSTGKVVIPNGAVGIGTTSPNALGFLETGLNIAAGSSSSTTLQQAGLVVSGSSDADDADDFGYLSFTNYQSTLSSNRVAEIRINKGGSNVNTGKFHFYTANGTALNESMVLGETGLLRLNQYGAGTLVTDASGNITVSSGGGAGGPYLPLAGGDMTGQTTHGDSIHTYWGNSNDLDIYHDNTFGSIIRDRGAGDLAIESNQAVRFRKSSTTEVMASMVPDGAVSLYYDNSKKLETTNTGITVTGAATATTFLGDLNGTINTSTTAVTKANATSDTTVATTAFVQNLIGTIPAGLVFQGTWDAATNTPTLAGGTGTTGHFYIVSTSGSTNLDGITDWVTGDWAVFVEQGATDAWEKVDNSSVLDGSGTGQKVALWSGSGTSNTLTDAPITVSGNDTTFAGAVTIESTGDKPLLFTKSTYGDFSTDAFYRIKFQDQGGVTNDVGLGQTATGSLGFNITAGKDFIFNNGTVGQILTLNGTGATFAGNVSLADNKELIFGAATDFKIYHNSTTNVNHISSQLDRQLALNANIIRFANEANTTERMRIDSAGNVGIGTTSPAEKLHVAGNVWLGTIKQNTGTLLQRVNSSWTNNTTTDVLYNAWTLSTGDYIVLRPPGNAASEGAFVAAKNGAFFGQHASTGAITDSSTAPLSTTWAKIAATSFFNGNVGIGTTSPTSKLHVVGAATSGSYAAYIHNASGGGNVLKLYNHDWDTGDFLLYATNGGTAGNGYGFTVDGNARVNIGLATVATAYTAADDLHLRSLGSNGITISSGNAQTGTIFFGDVANAAVAGFRYNHNTGDMAISAEDNITFACDNVGINTTAPVQKVHIHGGSAHSYLHFSNTDTGTTDSDGADIGINTSEELIIWQRENNLIKLGTNGSERMRITSTGKVLVGVTSNQTQSKLTSRQDGSSIEFGHLNQSGQYYGTLGSMASSGSPFIAFSADNSTSNTFTTRGAKGFVISQDTGISGDLIFSSVPLVSTANQNLAEKMRITSAGNVGIGTVTPDSKLQVDGGIQMADDTDTASASKVGTQRYRTSGNNSYVDMCMQTGATTYEWVNILENNW